MLTRNLLRAGAAIMLLGTVAACGNNDSPDDVIVSPPEPPPPVPPQPPTGGGEDFFDQFGAAFSAIFARAETADPVDPQQSDVPPLAPADDPITDDG